MNFSKLADSFKPAADMVAHVGSALKAGLEVGGATASGLSMLGSIAPMVTVLPVATIAVVTGSCAAISTLLKKADSAVQIIAAPLSLTAMPSSSVNAPFLMPAMA